MAVNDESWKAVKENESLPCKKCKKDKRPDCMVTCMEYLAVMKENSPSNGGW